MTNAKSSNIIYGIFIVFTMLVIGIILAFKGTKERESSSVDYDNSLSVGGYAVKINNCIYFTDTNEIVFTFKYKAGTTNYYGLQIVKNLVKASSGASCSVKAVATVTVGNVSDEVQFVYSIPITKGVGNQNVVTIVSGDDKYFAIREKGGSVVLTAMARRGASEITSGLTYKWSRMVNGAWQTLVDQTGKSLTVTDSLVDTTGIFKVEVSQGGNLIGLDTQTVMDLSDPYDIITNPNPEDETIVSGSGGSVTYTPILVKRGQTTKAKNMLFYFVFMDSAGVILNPATANVAAASGTCTEAMCQQAGGNVAWVITTKD